MNHADAVKKIEKAFSRYHSLSRMESAWLRKLKAGKLYELYCLVRVLKVLTTQYGYKVALVGNSIKFKSAPGMIDPTDPHFEISAPKSRPLYELYTDIEFETLGKSLKQAIGYSSYHEIDIIVVTPRIIGRPRHDQIALGVECKSHGKFDKHILKEVLGIRREMSFFSQWLQQSLLSQNSPKHYVVDVPAEPASEYWLAHLDPGGSAYRDSPAAFGIEFEHWQP